MSPEAPAPLALIIDDEEDLRQLARLALRVDGWRVEVAVDGKQGFELAKKFQPDIILVDLMMPSMSGVELCRRLIDDLQMWNTPMLMISAVNERAKILNDFWELPLRTRNFLGKPFDTQELIKAVRQLAPPEKRGQKMTGPKPSGPPPRPGALGKPYVPPQAAETVVAPPKQESRPAPAQPARPAASANPLDFAEEAHEPTPPPWMKLSASPPPPPPPPPAQESEAKAPLASRPLPKAPPPKPAVEKPAFEKPAASPPPPPAQPARPAPTPPPATPEPESPDKGYRILIMDDEEDIRMILEMGLGRRWTVQTAINGMDGLQKLDEFQPDFILSDMNMPVMNGLETAEAIRRHPRFGEVPIFFLTAETDASLPKKAFDLGANLFLRKPVDVVRVAKCIEYFLKEAAIQPGKYYAQSRREKEMPRTPPAAQHPRILVVDFNIENHRMLKRLLGENCQQGTIPGGPFETFWTDDPRAALGNLARWEPDLILYNPRNPNLDGITFGQTLRLNKQLDKTSVALIGTRFYDADIRYSEQTFKRSVISLEAPEAEIARQLGLAIESVRPKIRAKQLTWKQLKEEEVERLRAIQQSDAKKARERDLQKKRYQSVQDFIDRQVS